MPKTKKKFINKKKAVTFNLVHRSQKDPLIADESAPQRVLVPVNVPVPPRKEKEPELTPEQRKEEQHKYGIYFDDDYNYLQHLKDTKEVTLVMQPKPTHKRKEKSSKTTILDEVSDDEEMKETLQLPSSVFASTVEEDVGLLNKAASQGLCLEVDPEVVAALDEDFDFDDPDNQLEDNFIDLAMGSDDEELDEESDEDEDDDGNDSDKVFVSDLDSDDESNSQDSDNIVRGKMPAWEPRSKPKKSKSVIPESVYSASSSQLPRSEHLQLLDRRFEKMLEEYADTEIGALDHEEIEGHLPSNYDMVLKMAEEFEQSQKGQQLDKDEEIVRITRNMKIDDKEEMVTIEVKQKPKWDCETILSTYSNQYNRPKIIEEPKKPKKIQVHPRTGIPVGVLGKDKLTAKSLAKFNAMNETSEGSDDDSKTVAQTVKSTISVLSVRPKDETPEDKKLRKRLVKEYRRERRIEKKANKEAFKEEKKRQEKIMLNNRNNVQGNKIC